MATRFDAQAAVDFKNAAFAVVSGAISGTTPKQSGWIRVKNVDTVAFTLTTTSTANGVWTAEVATDYLGANAVAVSSTYISPAFPTGTSQNATPVITIPNRRYTHLRLTFTPSAGAGNANADTGVVTGRPINIERKCKGVAIYFDQSTATQAGQWAVEFGERYWDRDAGGMDTQDNLADPPLYVAAMDTANSAVSVAATTSGAANIAKRYGAVEFAAIRVKFTPTSGAGRVRAVVDSKG